MTQPPIGQLLARAREGDQVAWGMLTDRYSNLLWSIARSIRLSDSDAADAVQTTWLRLVENLDAIRDPDRLVGWLSTIVRRECYDIQRRTARLKSGHLSDPDGLEQIRDPADPLDAALLRDERDASLWRAFNGLKPSCRQLLRVLMADPPPSYAEVAAALEIAVGSIGPTRQRCLRCLRERLRAEDPKLVSDWEHVAVSAPVDAH